MLGSRYSTKLWWDSSKSSSTRTPVIDGSLAMHDACQAAGQRRRAFVLAATDAALQRSAPPMLRAGIARSAGVGRKLIYDHPDLWAEVELKLSQGARAQAACQCWPRFHCPSERGLAASRAGELRHPVPASKPSGPLPRGPALSCRRQPPDLRRPPARRPSSPGSATEGWRPAFSSWNNSSLRPWRRFAARPRSSPRCSRRSSAATVTPEAIPLVLTYDDYERICLAPAPRPFQRRGQRGAQGLRPQHPPQAAHCRRGRGLPGRADRSAALALDAP